MQNLKETQKMAATPKDKNQKGIVNHQKAAEYLEKAAKNHREAAKHHESGNHSNAAQSTVLAHGHIKLARKAQNKDAKQHAING